MQTEPLGLIGGTGIEGKGIGLRLGQAGLPVMIGSRSLERAAATAAECRRQIPEATVDGVTNLELFRQCRILFLTLPFQHAADFIGENGDHFRDGQILVDVTVPLIFEKGPQLLDLKEASGSEHLRQVLPSQIPMVATFKTLPAHLLADINQPLDCDEFVCSDQKDARRQVTEVLRGVAGIRWIDAGPLKYCRSLEAMTLLAIGINRRFKIRTGRFRVVGLDSEPAG